MALQIFEADGKELGSRQVPNFREIPGMGHVPERSYVYFCHRCGAIWGGLRIPGCDWTTLIFRPCLKHGDGRLSLQFPADWPLGIGADWPREALLREFLVELTLPEGS